MGCMSAGSVLEGHASEYADAFDDQVFGSGIGWGAARRSCAGLIRLFRVASRVGSASENSDRFKGDTPVRRDADFAAAENGGDFDLHGVALKIGFSQVDVEATENTDNLTTHEILGDDAAATTPKDVY